MKQWLIIRHIRYFYLLYRVNQHYGMWLKAGYLPVQIEKDFEVLDRVWRGEI